MSDLDNLLEGEDEPKDEAPEIETAEADELQDAEAPDGDEEGEDQAEAEPQQAEGSDDEKPKKPREQRSVPLAAFLETQRKLQDKLDAAEKRAAEFEAKAKEAPDFSKFFKKPPEETPSVYDDEEGYTKSGRSYVDAKDFNTRFGISASFAVRQFGQDTVNAALREFDEASQANPLMQQAIENSFDPVGEIMSWSQTQKTLRTIQQAGGLDAYEKNLRAQIEAELKAKKPAPVAADDDAEEALAQPKPNLPGNFNKGPKGGNKNANPHQSLDELLG